MDVPEDLVDLKRRFLALDRELAEAAARMPPSMAIVGGEQEVPEADRAAWDALWQRQDELALEILRHPAFAGLSMPDRYGLDAAASRAARSAG